MIYQTMTLEEYDRELHEKRRAVMVWPMEFDPDLLKEYRSMDASDFRRLYLCEWSGAQHDNR